MILLLWFLEKTTLGGRHVNHISLLVRQISASCRGKPVLLLLCQKEGSLIGIWQTRQKTWLSNQMLSFPCSTGSYQRNDKWAEWSPWVKISACTFFIDDIFYIDIFSIDYKHMFHLEDEQFLSHVIKQAVNIPDDIPSSRRLICGLAACANGTCTVWLGWVVEQAMISLISTC